MRRVVCLFFNGLMLCGPLPARALEPIVASAPLTKQTSPASGSEKRDVDFRPYMVAMQKTIKDRWAPPKMRHGGETKVAFKVNTTGEISDVRITKSSGSVRLDSAALKALRGLQLQALPQKSPASVDIDFTFDYKLHRKRST